MAIANHASSKLVTLAFESAKGKQGKLVSVHVSSNKPTDTSCLPP